jgi:hypothetical protein
LTIVSREREKILPPDAAVTPVFGSTTVKIRGLAEGCRIAGGTGMMEQ